MQDKNWTWEELLAIADKINGEGWVYVECLPFKEWKKRGYPYSDEYIKIIDHIAKARKMLEKVDKK